VLLGEERKHGVADSCMEQLQRKSDNQSEITASS